jgi:hypothetical protein
VGVWVPADTHLTRKVNNMALNANALILPGRGTVFVGNVDATPPAASSLAAITPAAPPTGYECIGHTSRDNAVAYSKDGGDATQLGSWWDDAIVTTYDPVTWSLTVNSLQVADSTTLELAFGGGTLDDTAGFFEFGNTVAVDKSVFVLMVDGAKRLGIYHPNTSVSLGDAPEVATDAFFEIQLAAQLLNSATTGKRFRFISTALIDAG